MNTKLTVYTGGDIGIRYGFHPTLFGEAMIAVADQGICALWFVGDGSRAEAMARLTKEWSLADIEADQEGTAGIAKRIFTHLPMGELKVHVQGTTFQVKVWEALLSLDPGQVTTYETMAQRVGDPSALRAMGSAIGRNPVAFVIPCHRVIRKSGELGGYRWGLDRKREILDWESAYRRPRNASVGPGAEPVRSNRREDAFSPSSRMTRSQEARSNSPRV